jgi:hypothetical protein
MTGKPVPDRRQSPAPAAAAVGRRVLVVGDYAAGRVPTGAVYIGRRASGLGTSTLATPFVTDRPAPLRLPGRFSGAVAADHEQAVELFRGYLEASPVLQAEVIRVGGRDVACWCSLSGPCHGDVILQWLATHFGAAVYVDI